MRIEIVTIFPDLFSGFLGSSLLGRALERGLLSVLLHDLREFTDDPHRVVDDEPFGGGGGMVMLAAPWLRAMQELTAENDGWRVLLSPQGETLSDAKVRELSVRPRLLFLCGRYEGVDERVRSLGVDEEISIGDYVLSGGEVAAMVLVEAISRQIPGVVGDPASVEHDSFRRGMLDYPQYTRPRSVGGLEVPEVLLSGHHEAIARWREKEALRTTLRKRPDLLLRSPFDRRRAALLEEIAEEEPVSPALLLHAKVKV
jgi:tRNA (guanine37-N1)-methyltransferase